MDTRSALLLSIARLIAEAKRDGHVIDVGEEAIRLSSEHPQSGMTIDDISTAIARQATESGAVIFYGSPKKSST